MKKITLKLAVLGALGLASAQAFAAGSLCALSTVPVGSAYINAYNAGRVVPPLVGPAVTSLASRMNFGSDSPKGASAGSCEITGLANDATAPLPGYGLQITSTAQNIMNAANTVTIGTVTERVWRKPAATAPVTPTNMCIIGTKVTLQTNAAYDSPVPVGQTGYFELNDIARGGYSGAGSVNVGYFSLAATPALSPVYRVGRTFTSVQHRAYKYGATQAERQNNGTGYLDLPTIGGSSTLNINGVNTPIFAGAVATATPAQQTAAVNSNWVDFTTDAVYADDDGGTNPVSAMTYVEFACGTNTDNAATINSTWRKAGALQLRRTAQENTTFANISLTGYAPPGATVP